MTIGMEASGVVDVSSWVASQEEAPPNTSSRSAIGVAAGTGPGPASVCTLRSAMARFDLTAVWWPREARRRLLAAEGRAGAHRSYGNQALVAEI